MALTIKFIPPEALQTALREVADKLGDCSEPLGMIARNWQDATTLHIRDGAGFAPMAAATVARYGPHRLLIWTGKMLGSLRTATYPFSAWVIANPTAILHERGRRAGVGAVSARARSKAPRARRTTAAKAATAAEEGRRTTSWAAMPARPFLFVDDAMLDKATDLLLEWTLGGWK